MEKSSKTFIEGKPVSVYANTARPAGFKLGSPNLNVDLKLQCLELALKLNNVEAEGAVEAAKHFYSYITEN